MSAANMQPLVLDPRRIRQNLLVNHRKRYVFLDNPKSASSTVKRELWDIEKAEGRKKGEAVATSIHGARFLKTSFGREIRDYFSFAVVRNPYSRVLSAYLDKVASERAAGMVFRKQAGLANDAAVSFADFVRAISKSTPIEDDRHWTLQYDNLLQECFRIDLIGSVENIGAFFGAFSERFKMAGGNLDRSPHATGAAEKVSRYYDDELQSLVAEKYRRDFEVFGYSLDLRDCMMPPALDGGRLDENPGNAELAWACLELGNEKGAERVLSGGLEDPRYSDFCRSALALRGMFDFPKDSFSLETENNPFVVRKMVSSYLESRDFENAGRAALRLIEMIPQWREGWVAMAAVAKSGGCSDAENPYLDQALLMTWEPGEKQIRERVGSLSKPRRIWWDFMLGRQGSPLRRFVGRLKWRIARSLRR